MAWAGTATVWTISGGLLSSCGIQKAATRAARTKDLYFVQISDSHIGFRGAANPDVTGTFTHAIPQVNALPTGRPSWRTRVTSPISARPTSSTSSSSCSARSRHRRSTPSPASTTQSATPTIRNTSSSSARTAVGMYYSFDLNGVHFLFLVNTSGVENLGVLGREQLDFIKKDLAGRSADTPLVVFRHTPLFATPSPGPTAGLPACPSRSGSCCRGESSTEPWASVRQAMSSTQAPWRSRTTG